ncbi:hypothetical protein [Flavobacterium sasangense]|uniref:hypothetical protein n=1 Tax=Flavobacterium sasangense TaxID=503361 RepID=UPI00047A98E4|nr:hypothetical protein [Flavobacterium sasangense]
MKKLLFILFLFPAVSFSQILIKDVSRMSYLDTPKNIHKTTEVLSNMSIYIESGYLFIKDDIETLKYKVIDTYLSDINGKETTVYEIFIKNEKYVAYVDSVRDSRFLFLRSVDDTDVSFFYEKRS